MGTRVDRRVTGVGETAERVLGRGWDVNYEQSERARPCYVKCSKQKQKTSEQKQRSVESSEERLDDTLRNRRRRAGVGLYLKKCCSFYKLICSYTINS